MTKDKIHIILRNNEPHRLIHGDGIHAGIVAFEELAHARDYIAGRGPLWSILTANVSAHCRSENEPEIEE